MTDRKPPPCVACQRELKIHCPSPQCDLWSCRTCRTVQTGDGRHWVRLGAA